MNDRSGSPSDRVIVVRPEPGLSHTLARLRERAIEAEGIPLFAVGAIAWQPPAGGRHDALLITSANAMRHGGPALATLNHLPVIAIGEASASAARALGFTVVVTGTADGAAAVAEARAAGYGRLLHLAGREHVALPGVEAVPVYASDTRDVPPSLTARFAGATVLLHSPRAARHLAALVDRDGLDRRDIAIAAFSDAVAAAAGTGWCRVVTAAQPNDAALITALVAAD